MTGTTGNQRGSVAKLLLKYASEYKVLVLTRSADSSPAKALTELGAEVVEADLMKSETLPAAVQGYWGMFGGPISMIQYVDEDVYNFNETKF
jgi:uncharacterized protein YbjT (DUF2867 family)